MPAATRHCAAKMRDAKLDCVIVPGGPSHWSFGGGMLWLTGHWEWHALCCYVVVPLEGEPTLVYSMGGTHCEAVRRETAAALTDVRGSRGGRYAEVMVDRIKRARSRAWAASACSRSIRATRTTAGQSVQHAAADAARCRRSSSPHGWMHELLSIHSDEELDCVAQSPASCARTR